MRPLVAALSLVLMSLLLMAAPASALDPPSEIQVTLSDNYASAQHLDLLFVTTHLVPAEFAQPNSDMNGAGVIRSKLLEVLPFEPGSTRASTRNTLLNRRLPSS